MAAGPSWAAGHARGQLGRSPPEHSDEWERPAPLLAGRRGLRHAGHRSNAAEVLPIVPAPAIDRSPTLSRAPGSLPTSGMTPWRTSPVADTLVSGTYPVAW